MSHDRGKIFRRFGVPALVVAALGLASTVSLGGLKTNQEVVFGSFTQGTNPPQLFNTAEGSLGSARASAGSTQYIGCSVKSQMSLEESTCFAKRQDGTKLTCTSTHANIARNIQAINGQSWIKFSELNGSCGYVIVENASNLQTTVF
jgi:hypothetical protein